MKLVADSFFADSAKVILVILCFIYSIIKLSTYVMIVVIIILNICSKQLIFLMFCIVIVKGRYLFLLLLP